jgi:mono/diheme cytochrome c family protein/Na+-transporting methylmalonyl-CoA/oxaloacetate decarboxylase gamma subunit
MDTILIKPQRRLLAAISFLFLFVISFNTAFAQDAEKLFKQNCAVCHSLGKNKITGPGMEGIGTRAPSDEWLFKWIKNNKEVIKSGDAYAKKILAENNGADMTTFTDLSDADINALIAYIKNPPAKKEVAAVAGPATGETKSEDKGVNPLAVLIGVIAFLIIIIAVLRGVSHSLRNIQNEKQGLPEEELVGPWQEIKAWMGNHKTTVAVIILFIVGGLLTEGWYALKDIGVYEGYQPTQPIAFSHKIHAGDNAINCQYCHSGVEKSKTAGIPAVNVCMNCHKGISSGPTTGTTEIAKIYEAAGWDPDKGEYNKPQKPIEWVKVHNLQDFVYFSHQQHVKVGKQDCATCHGDLKEMTTAKQVSPLTMGWCVDCHRKTEVPGMKDNPYYESLHKKLAEQYKGQPITVDKMGGIDCGRCHY